MWILIIVVMFVATIGLTMGGLLAAPKYPPRPLQVILFALAFSFICYVGMIFGMFMPSWFAFRFVEIVISIVSLLIIIAAVTRYHPTLGFFHPEDRVLPALLALLFFLMGFEWGILEMRTFFTLFAGLLFFFAMAFGIVIQIQIRQFLWRYSYHVYTPLIWLLFVGMLKLL
ncbi:hypothetical protein [Halalkalibacter sp. APA_J-10(15)]|uniref:hypothetical protein n=1 Tax=unclassified Halalkalibacter TaxID=2893063 RepID=UPI001FF3962A|nr:hypothetical protein [Halalkalibacter sp. APA_J-10(15)]MCK0471509.1 hypothetical protein [Halalkalibacter sp. APA_J-10(15)]